MKDIEVMINKEENDFINMIDEFSKRISIIIKEINDTVIQTNVVISSDNKFKLNTLLNKINIIQGIMKNNDGIQEYKLSKNNCNQNNPNIVNYVSNNDINEEREIFTKFIKDNGIDLIFSLYAEENIIKAINAKESHSNHYKYNYSIDVQGLITPFFKQIVNFTIKRTSNRFTNIEKNNQSESDKDIESHNIKEIQPKNIATTEIEESLKTNNNRSIEKYDSKTKEIIIFSKYFSTKGKNTIFSHISVSLTCKELYKNIIHKVNSKMENYSFHNKTIIRLYTTSKTNNEIKSLIDCYFMSYKYTFQSDKITKIINPDQLKKLNDDNTILIAIIITNNHDKFSIIKRNSTIEMVDTEAMTSNQKTFIESNIRDNGIENQGNICYMNCIFQCLFSTHYLNTYFFLEIFNKEPLESKYTMIIDQYYKLVLQQAFKLNMNPSQFKTTFEKSYEEFNDSKQHDAFEFLSSLLDCFHNELLRPKEISDKKLVENNFNRNLPIDEILELSISKINKYNETNNSIINDLFYGQLYTSIDCCSCSKIIHKFESFNILHLSLPQKRYKINLFFYYFQNEKLIYETTNIQIFEKTTLKSIQYGIHYNHPTIDINRIKHLYIERGNESLLNYLEYQSKTQIIFYEHKDNYVYCFPNLRSLTFISFSFECDQNIPYSQIIEEIKRNILLYNIEDVIIDNIDIKLLHPSPNKCLLCNGTTRECYLKESKANFAYLKGILEVLLFEIDLQIRNQSQTINTRNVNNRGWFSLQDCLDYYTDCDDLNHYNCQSCKIKVPIIKRTRIIVPPKYLIIQLKRMKVMSSNNSNVKKNEVFVKFPLTNFDISKYLVDQSVNGLYDLYGVVNHIGSIFGGHYTAYCKNNNKKWYSYSDKEVKHIYNDDDIISENAYLLFYEQKESL